MAHYGRKYFCLFSRGLFEEVRASVRRGEGGLRFEVKDERGKGEVKAKICARKVCVTSERERCDK